MILWNKQKCTFLTYSSEKNTHQCTYLFHVIFLLHQLTQIKAPLVFAASPVEYIQTYKQCFPLWENLILSTFSLFSILCLYKFSTDLINRVDSRFQM